MKVARSNRSVGIPIKGPYKVLVSLVTLVAFIFNIISYDLAWAARTPLELSGDGSNRAGSPGFIKNLNIDTFTLPEYLGRIKDSYKANSGQIVIHIQDAHCNYAAQKRIAEIIEYLNKEYGVNTVNLEGGAKDYDLSLFTKINDKAIRDKVADYFVKEGVVNGAEYFAINNPKKVTLWGIEDTKLYIDNLHVYRDSLQYKDEVEKHLKALTHILDNLKPKIYSQELLDLDTKYSQYKAGSLEFKAYLSYLVETAKTKTIDIKSFKNIYLLNQALAVEPIIDFRRANNERDDLIDRLQKRLSKNELEELVGKSVGFKQERISQKDFYFYLVSKARSINLELNIFPDLQKYIVYVSMYDAVDKVKVMDEIESLENKLKETLYRNDDERELNKLSKNLALTKNLFNISLTPDDYKYYKANEGSFVIKDYISFIGRKASLYNITAKLDDNATNLDDYRENMARFYECSFKRDVAFIKNLKFQAKTAGHRSYNAILITGGFHTENLYDIFRKQGISYISITPNFRNCDGYECPYSKLLAGCKENSVEKNIHIILSNAGMLAVPSPFTSLAKDIEKQTGMTILGLNTLVEATWVRASLGEEPKGIVITYDNRILGALTAQGNLVEKWNANKKVDFIEVPLTSLATSLQLPMSQSPATASSAMVPSGVVQEVGVIPDTKIALSQEETRTSQNAAMIRSIVIGSMKEIAKVVKIFSPVLLTDLIIKSFVVLFLPISGIGHGGGGGIGVTIDYLSETPNIIWILGEAVGIGYQINYFGMLSLLMHPAILIFLTIYTLFGVSDTVHRFGNRCMSAGILSQLLDWALFGGVIDWLALPFGATHLGDVLLYSGIIISVVGSNTALAKRIQNTEINSDTTEDRALEAETPAPAIRHPTEPPGEGAVESSTAPITVKPEGEGAGSWFSAKWWMERAYWLETGISFSVGMAVYGVLMMSMGVHEIASLIGFMIMPTTIFFGMQSFKAHINKETVLKLVMAKIAIGFIAGLVPGPLVAVGIVVILAIPLAIWHRQMDIRDMRGITAAPAPTIASIAPSATVAVAPEAKPTYQDMSGKAPLLTAPSAIESQAQVTQPEQQLGMQTMSRDIEVPPNIQSTTEPSTTKPPPNSLIGKLTDRNGNVVTSFNVVQKADSKTILIQHEGEVLTEVPIAKDIVVDKNTIMNSLTHFLDSRKANLPPHVQDLMMQLIEKMQNVNSIVALEPHKDVKGAFYEENGQYTLYLNKNILNNPLALIHELGEGALTLPKGYKHLTRHTAMRGVGKDVRNAFDAVGETKASSSAKTAGELIKILEEVMKKEDFTMSNNRSRDSPITKSEKDLIRLNFKNDKKGKEVLFGVQDFLTVEGNARFTQDIRNVTNDLRQGVLNIFLVRSRIDTKSAETAVGRNMSRKLEKKLGINTHILYFEDKDALGAQLTKALAHAATQENKDKLPKIFVDCLTKDDLATVNDFIKTQEQAGNKAINQTIAIGRDFIDGEAPRELPDEVKVILVGSAIMNDRRLRDDFKMSSTDLLESRKRIINFLKNNKIIDDVAIADDQVDSFFNDLWQGFKRLLITRINWKELQDWKNSQDEVLRAL